MIQVATGLSLPLEAVTQTFGILAKRRVGKSYTARRFAEQLFKAGQQIVIADPKGDWWGIRSSASGKSPGLPVVIIGGERGDVKLEPSAGEVVAKLVVEERVSALLDLSLLRKHEVATFMTAFLENLYRLKAHEQHRTPVMLFLDEADAIAPQKPQENEARMLGAAEDIVRRGGQRGIGCTLITQRSAVLNKNVLTQCEMLVALRTIAPQDLAALKEWIDVHGTVEGRKTLMESLPSLPKGDAWFWSPGWPTEDGIFKRVHVLPIETFDSGATPAPGEKRDEPKSVADVDLAALSRQMAATIEKAKADDPKLLRAKVAALEKELAAARSAKAPKAPAAKRVEVPVVTRAQERTLQAAVDKVFKAAELLGRASTPIGHALDKVRDSWNEVRAPAGASRPSLSGGLSQRPRPVPPAAAPRAARIARASSAEGDEHLASGERAVLTGIAQHPDGVTREQLSVVVGYKKSTRDLYLQRLAQRGLIDQSRGLIIATPGGFDALGSDFEPLPTGDALREHWLAKLPAGETKVLREIVNVHPKAITTDELTASTGYQKSTRDLYLQRLAARRLIEKVSRGQVRASDLLFSR